MLDAEVRRHLCPMTAAGAGPHAPPLILDADTLAELAHHSVSFFGKWRS
jgi:hypothetical protein